MAKKDMWKGTWRKQGFLLTETMLALSIGALLLGAMGFLLYQSLLSQRKMYDIGTQRLESEYAIEYMIEELGSADVVQIDENHIHIIHENPSKESRDKFHRVTYMKEGDRLYRFAGKYRQYPKGAFHTSMTKGKNMLCDGVQDFYLRVEKPYIHIRLLRKDDRPREEFFALRCPVEVLP